jgi:hypothetical protein
MWSTPLMTDWSESPELSPTAIANGRSETQCFSVFSVPCSSPDPVALMLLRNQMAGLEFYDAVVNNDLQSLKRLVAQYKLDLNAKFQQVRFSFSANKSFTKVK